MTEYGTGANYWNNPWETQEWRDKLNALNVKWIRRNAQRSDPTHEYGRQLEYLKAQGYKLLFVFAKRMKGWGSGDWLDTVDIADWEEQIDWFLATYGHLIDAVEFGNEPDLAQFNFGYMDGSPARYYEMLQSVYAKVKAYNYSIPVIAGGTATLRSTQQTQGDYYGGWFMQQIVALGAGNYCDAWSFHCYRFSINGQEGIASAKDAYDRLAQITGDGKPIWMTEFGVNGTPQWGDTAFFLQVLNDLKETDLAVFNYYSFYESSLSLLEYGSLNEQPWYFAYKDFIELATPISPLDLFIRVALSAATGVGLIWLSLRARAR